MLWSEIEDRIDPKYNTYIHKYKVALPNAVKLGTLLSENPMYGANETAVKYDNICRYIRITDVNEHGILKSNTLVSAENTDYKYKVELNDILFARSGATVGKTYIHEDENLNAIFAGYMIKIKIDKNKINPKFVYYYTQLDIYKKWIDAVQRSAGQPNVNSEEYKDLDIPLLDINKQTIIIEKMNYAHKLKNEKEEKAKKLLDSIDDYILNKLGIILPKVQEENTNISLLHELISDRIDPYYHKKKFKFYETSLLNSNFRIAKLKELIKKLKTGTTPANHLEPFSIDNTDIPFFRNTNLQKNQILIDDVKYIKTHLKQQLTYSNKDEVLICIAGTVGVSAVNNYGSISINQNVSSIELKEGINPYYISYFLNTELSYELIKRSCSIATILYLNNDNLKNILIPLPNIEIQNEIVKVVRRRLKHAEKFKYLANKKLEKVKEEVTIIILGE